MVEMCGEKQFKEMSVGIENRDLIIKLIGNNWEHSKKSDPQEEEFKTHIKAAVNISLKAMR